MNRLEFLIWNANVTKWSLQNTINSMQVLRDGDWRHLVASDAADIRMSLDGAMKCMEGAILVLERPRPMEKS